jgi:hypothetical protein
LIVDAADDISDAETEDGFRWRLDAICRAARFCAKVVPVDCGWGVVEGWGEEEVERPMPKPETETPDEERGKWRLCSGRLGPVGLVVDEGWLLCLETGMGRRCGVVVGAEGLVVGLTWVSCRHL